jgi:hypothetical protein
MRIHLISRPENEVIAREEQLSGFEGDFVLAKDGVIHYIHPTECLPWFAAPDEESFRKAAAAWNKYGVDVGDSTSEEEAMAIVDQLRSELAEIGVLNSAGGNLWEVLLEQAADGLL